MSTAPELDRARARWRALHAPGAVAALIAERRAAVATTVWRTEASEDHSPAPYWPQQLGRVAAHTLAAAPAGADATRVGLDAAGRPVVAEALFAVSGRPLWTHLLTWGDGAAELVTPRGESACRELELYAVDGDGRATALLRLRAPDTGTEPFAEHVRFTYDEHGRPALALSLSGPGQDGAWGGSTTRFVHDDSGRLARVEHLAGGPPLAPGGDVEAAFAAALALRVPEDYDVRSLVWDGRFMAFEPELPAPEVALDGVAEPLAAAVRAALAAVADAVPEPAFAVVDLLPAREGGRGYELVRAATAGRGGRDRARTVTEQPGAVLSMAYKNAADTATLDLLDAATPALRRALRAAVQAYRIAPEQRAAAVAELATELASALDFDPPPGVAPGFVALVRAGDAGGRPDASGFTPHGGARTYPAARAGLGDDAVDAFLATLTGTPPAGLGALGAAERAAVEALLAGADLPARDDGLEPLLSEPGYYARAEVAVPDRPTLAALLTALGMTPADATTAADDARWAIVLAPDGSGATRMGGRPVLPAGMAWPTAGGRALTHLATLALDELPDVEGRDALPAAGHLAFFADLTEAGELYDQVHPDDAEGSDRMRVVHVAAGAPAHEPAPPAGGPPRDRRDPPALLAERRVRPTPRLQLRYVGDGWALRKLGIDAVGERVLERAVAAINGGVSHQLLGFPLVVQSDTRADAEEALLHIGANNDIGFSILDGGDAMFTADRDELRAGRLDRITLLVGSC